MGALGTAAIAAMDARLPWFRKMTAENRSWLGLVAQAGIAVVRRLGQAPGADAPGRDRGIRYRPARAGPGGVAAARGGDGPGHHRRRGGPGGLPGRAGREAELREAVLVYAREIAFSAAQVYARTAEARGAWDARLEALVVDSLVRGEGRSR